MKSIGEVLGQSTFFDLREKILAQALRKAFKKALTEALVTALVSALSKIVRRTINFRNLSFDSFGGVSDDDQCFVIQYYNDAEITTDHPVRLKPGCTSPNAYLTSDSR